MTFLLNDGNDKTDENNKKNPKKERISGCLAEFVGERGRR